MAYENPFASLGNVPSMRSGGYQNPFANLPSAGGMPSGMSRPSYLGNLPPIPVPQPTSSAPGQVAQSAHPGFLTSLLNAAGDAWNQTIGKEYSQAKGGLEGLLTGLLSGVNVHTGQAQAPTNAMDPLTGYFNPQQEAQKYQGMKGAMGKGVIPWALSAAADTVTEPLTYAPIGGALKVLGKVTGATDALKAAGSAIKDSGLVNNKVVTPLVNQLGKNFVKFYGANQGVKDALQQKENMLGFFNENIRNEMTKLAQQHALTPEELNIFPHVWEGTQTTNNQKVLQAVKELQDALHNGVGPFKGMIGTQAELNTKLNDQPILQRLRQNYFPHMYKEDPQTVAQILEGQPTKSFSTTGPFNQMRQFNTLQDAMNAGLNPVLDPYLAVGNRLMQSAKAVTNANTINTLLDKGLISLKDAPGLAKSQVLNSLKWLDNSLRPVTETKTQMLQDALGHAPIDVNPASEKAVSLNADKFTLPKELQGAKPRYKNSPIEFSNPFDKAAYIVGNTANRSARDADYLSALMQHTGLDEPSVRALGQTVRDTLKQQATNAEGSTIKLPQVLQSYMTKQYENQIPAETAATMHIPSPSDIKDDSYFSSLTNTLPNEAKRVSYYVNPNDEGALKQALGPYKEPGAFMNAFDKTQGLWKQMAMYNPLVHGHNIGVNGMWLGGAKPSDVLSAFKDIRNDPSASDYFQRALMNGAISADRGSLNNALEKQLGKVYNPGGPGKKFLSGVNYLRHGFLWDSDKAIRTALFKKGAENGMSDPEAANMVNKFMVNYNNTTPFEQNVMGRIFPFYRWMKGNIPLQVDQWINNTPKQMSQEVLKNAMSQAFSGQNTQDGKINTGVQLPGGYNLMFDPYTPTDEPIKMMREGPLPFLYGKVNPVLKEIISQATNKAYYPSGTFAPNGKGSMADISIGTPGAPASYNYGERADHALKNLLPLGGFPFRQVLDYADNLPNPTKPSPGIDNQALEGILRLSGGFPSTDNPQLDNYYNTKDQQTQLQGFIKYLRKMGEPVPKDLTKQAYVKIPFPGGQ